MNSPTLHKPSRNVESECTDLLTSAERELAAFFGAVKELFGPEHAERSAQDWLHELEISNRLPASSREWRSISAKVMARLALRVNGLCLVQ